MALGDWLSRRRVGDGIAGEAEVLRDELTWAGAHQTEKRNLGHVLRLSVTTPTGGTYEVEHRCSVAYDRVPYIGQVLPVRVSSSDPQRLVVEWDKVETTVERAQRLVEER